MADSLQSTQRSHPVFRQKNKRTEEQTLPCRMRHLPHCLCSRFFCPKSTYSKQDMKTLTSILVLLFGLQAATAQPLQRVAPEQAGLDSRKLMYADEAIETAIAGKEIPGAVLAVVRNGKMAYLKAYGNKRIYPDTEPMTVNTVFDMASCSKSISTAVCTMILAERGKIRLLDPVSRYIPGFKDWESEDGKDKR